MSEEQCRHHRHRLPPIAFILCCAGSWPKNHGSWLALSHSCIATSMCTFMSSFHILTRKELMLIHGRGYRHIEEAHHHLVVSLIAPDHGAVGIRIVWIVGGVVVPRDGLQFGSGLDEPRLGKPIAELPIKIIIHAKQSFAVPAGDQQVVLESLAPKVHVRKEAE